ncbi:MAG: hypothetical protein ACI4LA_02255 [Emergencia sp.]
MRQLFKAFYAYPKQLPDYVLEKYCARNSIAFNRAALDVKTLQADSKFIRTIYDHIAGMTDQFAATEYNRLYAEKGNICAEEAFHSRRKSSALIILIPSCVWVRSHSKAITTFS